MSRHFNTGGPCNPKMHYMLAPELRLPTVREVIAQQAYFVLHGPRQVGKTTSLLALAKSLTAEGRYTTVLVSMETGAAFPEDVGAAEEAVLEGWRARARAWLSRDLQPPSWPAAAAGSRIGAALETWAQACPRSLVVFLDEIDALRETVLLSVLKQLRDRHPNRPGGFPWSRALVGLRDVRDYKVASGGSDVLHTASPFNIKVESLSMRNFTETEVGELYAQHTMETAQRFDADAVSRAFELSFGQPWLVNALARQLVETLVTDRTQPVTRADVDKARDILIERQDTHLDSLVEGRHAGCRNRRQLLNPVSETAGGRTVKGRESRERLPRRLPLAYPLRPFTPTSSCACFHASNYATPTPIKEERRITQRLRHTQTTATLPPETGVQDDDVVGTAERGHLRVDRVERFARRLRDAFPFIFAVKALRKGPNLSVNELTCWVTTISHITSDGMEPTRIIPFVIDASFTGSVPLRMNIILAK